MISLLLNLLKIKLKFILALALFSTSSYFAASEAMTTDSHSLILTIGYKNGSTSINHKETSASVGFTTLLTTVLISKRKRPHQEVMKMVALT